MTTQATPPPPARPPRHVRVVGALALVWNAFGALDHAVTQLGVGAYAERLTPAQLAYLSAFPWWAEAAWAAGVWGAVAGSVGLLLRRRWAVWAFALSVVGMAAMSLYTYGLSGGLEAMGGWGTLLFTLVVWGVGLGLFVYALAMAKRGALR